MKKIIFKNDYTNVVFQCKENKIFIESIAFSGKEYVYHKEGMQHSNVFFLGKYYPRGKMFNRYEFGGEDLLFVGAKERQFDNKKELIVEEKNEKIFVKTIYELYDNSATLQCRKEIINLLNKTIYIESASPLTLKGIMVGDDNHMLSYSTDLEGIEDLTTKIGKVERRKKICLPWLWKAHNTWCSEACFEKVNLETEGLRAIHKQMRCGRIVVAGNGVQTTNRFLPLGLLEKENYGFFSFEILPVGSWSYEITAGYHEAADEWTLALLGRNFHDNGWYRALQPNETHCTEEVRIVGDLDIDGIVRHNTVFRRNVKAKNLLHAHEDIVYNVYMHNLYISAYADKVEKNIPIVSELGADYFVIDAGWHDDMSVFSIGEWKESIDAYPNGLQKTIDKVREKGMKFGLWIEVQSVGIYCADKNLLPDKCYFSIAGERLVGNGRYHVDFSVPETREWADNIVKRLVEKYSVDYIKIDKSLNVLGGDCTTGSLSERLRLHSQAYLDWFENIQKKHPQVLFENCSSGGMLMDSNIAKRTSVFSISDQSDYLMYPYILCNLSLGILPEQMGIWCMPVDRFSYPDTDDEKLICNVINALYGCMHLSSKLEVLTDKQKELLKEGLKYYKKISKIKNSAIPVLPRGLASLDDEIVVTGLKENKKLYLFVYNLSETEQVIKQNLSKYLPEKILLAYPHGSDNEYCLDKGVLKCSMQGKTARVFELDLQSNSLPDIFK